MRFAVVITLPVEVGNEFEKDPKAGEFFARYLEELKPEAAYFSSSRRWTVIITKAESQEELTQQLLPVWHKFKTHPQVEPVSSLEEFKAILPKLSELVKDV